MTTQNMSFERPFTFVFKDPNWVKKILMGGLYNLLSIIVIGSLVVMGYQKRFFLALLKDENAQMPEIEFGSDLAAGLPVLGIFLCYWLPAMLLSAIPCLGIVFRMVLPVVLAGVVPIALTRFFVTDRFSAAFEFREIYEFIRANLNNSALFLGIALVSGMAAGLGIIACVVGIAFTGFWALNVNTVALADLHRLALQAPSAQPSPAAAPPASPPPASPPPSEPSP